MDLNSTFEPIAKHIPFINDDINNDTDESATYFESCLNKIQDSLLHISEKKKAGICKEIV